MAAPDHGHRGSAESHRGGEDRGLRRHRRSCRAEEPWRRCEPVGGASEGPGRLSGAHVRGCAFVEEHYAQVIPLLEKILAADPYNLDAALRLATAHSSLGHDAKAIEAFRKAAAIAPQSPDVRTYLALHYARGKDWQQAVPMLERIVADTPERLPAVEALAVIRERQGRIEDAIALRQKIATLRTPNAAALVRLGQLAMQAQQTAVALDAFEQARKMEGPAFRNDLELGVLYLSSRKLIEARDALDRVQAARPEYPMALFKRAQVSVLLKEPDSAARIARARQHADRTTRELIARERLFQ